MSSHTPRTVTVLLQRWSAGDASALDELLPQVYDALRQLAASAWRGESAGHTLQPTAVVHEAVLRLLDQQSVSWESRTHFLAIAARMMRRVLADWARRRRAQKRGGEVEKVELDERLHGPQERPDLLVLDDALTELERLDPRQAEVVSLRFLGGLSVQETAVAMSLSPATVKREWHTARAWLQRELVGGPVEGAADVDSRSGPAVPARPG